MCMACEEEEFFYRLYLERRAQQEESAEAIAANAELTAAFFGAFPVKPVPVRGAAAEKPAPDRFICDGPAGE
jgi:hypothetical protein